MGRKVLIVKLGITETIDGEIILDNISLGDIFRTTAVLHLFKDDHVTWLTSKGGVPLLEGNPYIDKILVYDLTSVLQLQSEHFDVLINLEKVPGVCAFADKVTAWSRYGFRFNVQTGTADAYEGAFEVLANSDDPELRRRMKKNWIEVLYEMIGAKWNEESYVLGYKPKTEEMHDIGFNFKVGRRWPNKTWPEEKWDELERLIGDKYSVSRQQALDNIQGYMDWINSCRLIVTSDSLGLHLAIALKKKIIALFGPTSEKEVYLFNLGVALRPPADLDCMPCFSSSCVHPGECVETITAERVYENITKLL